MAEEILGKAIGKRRDQLLIATKANARMEQGPQRAGFIALSPDPCLQGKVWIA